MKNSVNKSSKVQKEFPSKPSINNGKEGVKIVKVAAFCFAIISFIATAEGLATCVFEYSWQAYLISFGIQSILFVLNLKLPKYFSHIGDMIPTDKKKLRRNGKSYRWTIMQRTVALFYVAVIFSSSWFSYVYIVNMAYKNTLYIDSNITLDGKYREYLSDTQSYINEYIKNTQLLAVKHLSELPGSEEDGVRTKETIEADVEANKRDLAEKIIEEESAKDEYEIARANYLEPMESRWRSDEEHEMEYQNYLEAKEKYKIAQIAVSDIESNLEELQKELNASISSFEAIKKGFLIEIIKQNPSLDDYMQNGVNMPGLRTYVTQLNECVISSKQTENDKSEGEEVENNFNNIVENTEEISILINNYISLREAQNLILDIESSFLKDTVEIPDNMESSDDEVRVWTNNWEWRMTKLEQVVKSVPEYSELYYTDEYKDVINYEVLSIYDKQSISNDIGDLIRNHLSSISKMELAARMLVSNYPFLAWFSLILAVFFDIASLLAGLFVYYVSKKNVKDSENENGV